MTCCGGGKQRKEGVTAELDRGGGGVGGRAATAAAGLIGWLAGWLAGRHHDYAKLLGENATLCGAPLRAYTFYSVYV